MFTALSMFACVWLICHKYWWNDDLFVELQMEKIPAKKTKVSDERVFPNKPLLKWLCNKSLCLHFCPAALSWEEHLLQDAKYLVFFKVREVWFCGTWRLWGIDSHSHFLRFKFYLICLCIFITEAPSCFQRQAYIWLFSLSSWYNINVTKYPCWHPKVCSCFSWQELYFFQYSNWQL